MKWKLVAISFVLAAFMGTTAHASGWEVSEPALDTVLDPVQEDIMQNPLNLADLQVWEIVGTGTLDEDGMLFVEGEMLYGEHWDEVELYVADALVYDLRSGLRTTAAALSQEYPHIPIHAVYVPIDEPLGHAVIMYCYADDEGSADFYTVAGENIRYGDGLCVFMTMDGKFRIVIDERTPVFTDSGQPVRAEDIRPGAEMLIWAGSLTASFPGQLTPERVVIMDY